MAVRQVTHLGGGVRSADTTRVDSLRPTSLDPSLDSNDVLCRLALARLRTENVFVKAQNRIIVFPPRKIPLVDGAWCMYVVLKGGAL